MRFHVLAPLGLVTVLLVSTLLAIPTTEPGTATPSTASLLEASSITTGATSTSSILQASSGETTETTETTGTSVTELHGSKDTALLRDNSPNSHRLRGRVVLANTRIEGSDEWGVDADQAEMACNRIARYQSENAGSGPSLLSGLLERFLSNKPFEEEKAQPMEGHLLSIGSSYEVLALSRLLSPLPDGAYWTGGKLVRYRVNNMHRRTSTDHVVLTWSDGRVGRPSVLGLTRLDEEQLSEGHSYCLALNLKEATWQARECTDRLPYACLITPRHIGFSNKAAESQTETEAPIDTTEPQTSTEMPTSMSPMQEVTESAQQSTNMAEVTEAAQTTGDLLSAEVSTLAHTTPSPVTMLQTESENSAMPMLTTTETIPTEEENTAETLNPVSTESAILIENMTPTNTASTEMTTDEAPLVVNAAFEDWDFDKQSTEQTNTKPLSAVSDGTSETPTTAELMNAVMHESTGEPTTDGVWGAVMHEITETPTTAGLMNAVMHESTGEPTTDGVLGAVMHEITETPTTAGLMNAVMHESTGEPTTDGVLGAVMLETTETPVTLESQPNQASTNTEENEDEGVFW